VCTGDGDEDDDEVEARSNGKNCGCAALNRRRWRVAELRFNEKSLLPSLHSVPLRLSVKQ
jgi:hypothetical protein